MPERKKKILVIKLAALGDFVQAMGPFAAIRAHHPDAHITLLTSPPFIELAHKTELFDRVWGDSKPRGAALRRWLALRRMLRSGDFERVYDLQTSDRSSFYRRLFWPGKMPEWSGIAGGCSHPHDNPNRDFMHTIERQTEQLKMAGIEDVPGPEVIATLSGLDAPLANFGLDENFALLVVGGAAHRIDKRWPAEKYGQLAGRLADQGLTPVLLGSVAESETMDAIAAACPKARNLCGQTSLLDIAALARRARFALGNDSGPMHLIAGLGCPSLVLYSQASDPDLCGQRGAKVSYMRRDYLTDLGVDEVMEKLELA